LSSSPRRVLVADVDEIVVALISHILHRQGYVVDVALSLTDATASLARSRYDAVIVDAKLCDAVAAFPDRLARTILLGPPESDSPVFATLPKPIEFGSLVETVAACVK